MLCRVISYGYDKTTFAPSIFNFFAKISRTGSAILSFSALIKYYTHAKLTIETYEYDTVMLPNNLNLQQNDHSCVFLFFYISGKSTIELSSLQSDVLLQKLMIVTYICILSTATGT